MSSNPAYDVQSFSQDALFEALSNTYYSSDRLRRQHRVAGYLFGYLKDLLVTHLVVEFDYIDLDHLSDYAIYYSRCFEPYGRRCRRIHFFSCEKTVDREAFVGLLKQFIVDDLSQEKQDDLRDRYRGFVVARPLPNAIIGRTVLATYPSLCGKRHYPTTLNYSGRLFGAELPIESLAYQEQDTVLAACATVAVWCALQKTSELFGSVRLAPSRITTTASEGLHNGRVLPSRGLTVVEMCNAIRAANLEPELVECNLNLNLASLVYAYVRGGIPVLLGVQIGMGVHHAIAVTGYSLGRSPDQEEQELQSARIPSVADSIDEFYVHDDQVGPFARCKLVETDDGGVVLNYENAWLDDSGDPIDVAPFVALIPIYHKVRVRYVDLRQILLRLDALLRLCMLSPELRKWDVYLTQVNLFKEEVRRSNGFDLSEKERILLGLYPKYLWRASLLGDGRPCMDVLVDATDIERAMPVVDIIWYDKTLRHTVSSLMSIGRDDLDSALKTVLGERLFERLRQLLSVDTPTQSS